jgi:hypothetical protein
MTQGEARVIAMSPSGDQVFVAGTLGSYRILGDAGKTVIRTDTISNDIGFTETNPAQQALWDGDATGSTIIVSTAKDQDTEGELMALDPNSQFFIWRRIKPTSTTTRAAWRPGGYHAIAISPSGGNLNRRLFTSFRSWVGTNSWTPQGGSGAATYRTICVRMCDGYFFPVSFSTLPSHFPQDADACTNKCAAPTELYYYPNPGGTVEQAVALKSQEAYTKLKVAFRYRKEFVNGCSCKEAEYVPASGTPDKKAEGGTAKTSAFPARRADAAAPAAGAEITTGSTSAQQPPAAAPQEPAAAASTVTKDDLPWTPSVEQAPDQPAQ